MDPVLAFRLFLICTSAVAGAMLYRGIATFISGYRYRKAYKAKRAALSPNDRSEVEKFEEFLRSPGETDEQVMANFERIYGEKP
jgi:hypothetical protein